MRKARSERQTEEAKKVYDQLQPAARRLLDCASEKGASSWISTLPIEEHGYCLSKVAFRDAISLRYGWTIQNVSLTCACGTPFSVDHAMSCHKGGLPTLRHNKIRDLAAELLKEVCHNVSVEPGLQALDGERIRPRTANRENEARLDIRANGFWSGGQEAFFFDVRVFQQNAPTYCIRHLTALYRLHEGIKKREYSERVREVECGVFTFLVLLTTGGMARECTFFFERVADAIAEKRKLHYSQVMGWLRCRTSFALIRSAIMAIRGSRSKGPCGFASVIPLAFFEGKVGP